MVLIDSGATHSLASMIYVKKLDRSPEKLLDGFNTTLPSGEIFYSNYRFKEVPIHIDVRNTNNKNYDVILSMDWLSKYNATIDYKEKGVIFHPSEED